MIKIAFEPIQKVNLNIFSKLAVNINRCCPFYFLYSIYESTNGLFGKHLPFTNGTWHIEKQNEYA